MELVDRLPPREAFAVVAKAQGIWIENYGVARLSGTMRRNRSDKGKSQSGWDKRASIGATLKSNLGLSRASVKSLSGTDGAAVDVAASVGNLPS